MSCRQPIWKAGAALMIPKHWRTREGKERYETMVERQVCLAPIHHHITHAKLHSHTLRISQPTVGNWEPHKAVVDIPCLLRWWKYQPHYRTHAERHKQKHTAECPPLHANTRLAQDLGAIVTSDSDSGCIPWQPVRMIGPVMVVKMVGSG